MRIPTGNFGQVVAQPQQAPNIPSGAFVTGSAAAMQETGRQLAGLGSQLFEKHQEQEDIANTMGAERQLSDWQMGALFDPEKGAFSTKGRAAMGITKPTLSEFDKQAESISKTLTSAAQKQAFQRIALSRRMQVQAQLATHERTESEAYAKGEMRGFMQTALNAAALQFNDPDAVQREVTRSAGALTAFATAQGWSEEQLQASLQEQISSVHSAVAERKIQANPSEGLDYVQKNMSLFSAAEGARLQRSAINATESRMRLSLAYEARAERLREKQDKLRAQNAAKAGDLLRSQGELTPEWVEKNRDSLTPSDYRYFHEKLLNDSPERTDPMVYSGLRQRLAVGDDVSEDARNALQLGLLKPDDYERIITIQDKSSIAGEVPSAYKRGVRYIQGALRVSDLNPDPAAAQRQASALNDFDDWMTANPKATDSEAQQTYQRIVRDYQLTDTMESSLVKPMPSYAVGGRRDLNIEATEQATVQAFLDKHGGNQQAVLSDPEFQRQSLLIEEWKPIMELQRAARAKRDSSNERR